MVAFTVARLQVGSLVPFVSSLIDQSLDVSDVTPLTSYTSWSKGPSPFELHHVQPIICIFYFMGQLLYLSLPKTTRLAIVPECF